MFHSNSEKCLCEVIMEQYGENNYINSLVYLS